eukprot:TRINITY_DN360_c0_g1_i1.p1 TRINITY_DN360_c0_g1~~TRINITY_DN360_c0_g1_i1.p1  ORF type:complete len:349 (+),score=115.83 TRINITY_DN360_c0_g1_i1:147-1193(+)
MSAKAEEPVVLEDLDIIGHMPYNIQRRLYALKNIHKQFLESDKKCQEEVRELERKYQKIHEPLFQKRAQIITGEHEPTDEESKSEDTAEDIKAKKEKTPAQDDLKGIPEFWLTVMQNNNVVAQSIFEADEEALGLIKDIKVTTHGGAGQKNSFDIEFFFGPNPFFEESVLKKTYHLEEDDMFGELMLDHATATKPTWKEGKNLTVKLVKKKQKQAKGKKGPVKVKTVEEPCDSFFNFFYPPTPNPENEEPEDDQIEADFEIGCSFKDKLVPYSVLWFTGEAAEYDDFGGFGEDDDFGGFGGEGDDEDDDDEPVRKPAGKKGGNAHSFAPPPNAGGAPGQPAQPECKQQ